MSKMSPRWLCLGFVLALGCGGATENQSTTTARVEPEPAPEPEPVEEAEPEPVEEPEPEEAEPEPEEAEAPPEPIVAGDADAIFEVLKRATFEADVLRRLVDPQRGVGTHDSGRTGVAQHCDVSEVADHPGTSFAVNEGDTFRCDRDLSRCTSQAPDGSGYSFYFRTEGERLFLDAIVHHASRVPRTDSRAVRGWVEAGEGVCALWRAAHATDRPAPARFSVFVSEQTGLVPELVSDHHCGDEARAAFAEQMASYTGQDLACDRGPARCSFRRGDEEITFYGDDDGLAAIATTRPGMYPNLERAQRRDLDRFLRDLRGHACE